LSFQSSPIFENPRDSNVGNIYQVTIVASDGQLSTSLGITISVNGVFEGLGRAYLVNISQSLPSTLLRETVVIHLLVMH